MAVAEPLSRGRSEEQRRGATSGSSVGCAEAVYRGVSRKFLLKFALAPILRCE